MLYGIAIKLSATTRRLSIIESHVSAMKPKETELARTRTQPQKPANTPECDKDYWRNTTYTLSGENTELKQRLSKLEEEYKQLKHAMTRSTAARKELEKNLNEANKELFHLSTTHSRRIVPKQPVQLRFAVPPSSAIQNKDASFWYQTCRSMEAQYIQRNNELEAKVDELMEIVSAKRKRPDT